MWCLKLITLCTCVVLLSSDVVHGKYIYHSDVQRSIGQSKVVATWEEAKKRCENAGAILASPIDEKLLKHMLSYIDVNNHTNPYFIGIKAKYNPKPEFYSAEGVFLDDLPEVILNMIVQLDSRDGDCLAMNRDSIRVVPCWNRYPYICYTKLKSNEPEEKKTLEPTKAAPTTESTTKESSTTKSTTKESKTTENVTETTIAPECDYEGYEYYPATGRCYRLHTRDKNWSDANTTCDDEGGYLVIVNDFVEAMTLAKIIKDNYVSLGTLWIGHLDITGNNDWRSIHADPLDKIYRHRSDYKRLYAKPSTCGTILSDATLFDHPCNRGLAFVCEKSL